MVLVLVAKMANLIQMIFRRLIDTKQMIIGVIGMSASAFLYFWMNNLRSQVEEERKKLASMCVLRDNERKGRINAEKMLRSNAQQEASTDGYKFQAIGVVQSPFSDRRGTPRQPAVCPAAECIIMMDSAIPASSLDELERFTHVWVLFVFHENTRIVGSNKKSNLAKIMPPRLNRKVGVLSTRSPHRPNPIGLSVCRLLSVDYPRIHLGGIDFVDGTPVLDIKPYTPYDSVPNCGVPEWVEPPIPGDLTSGLCVEFSQQAKDDISSIFQCSKHFGQKILRHFSGRQADFELCLEQVIKQDPRSSSVKKKSDSSSFNLCIDGIEASFCVKGPSLFEVIGARIHENSSSSPQSHFDTTEENEQARDSSI